MCTRFYDFYTSLKKSSFIYSKFIVWSEIELTLLRLDFKYICR